MLIIILISCLFVVQVLVFIFLSKKLDRIKTIILTLSKKEEEAKEAQDGEPDEDAWEEEMKRTVELQCLAVRNAVYKQTIDLHKKEIEYAPRKLTVPDQSLAALYSEEQRKTIHAFWTAYERYLQNHWYTDSGKIKTVFKGQTTDPDSEAGKLTGVSKQLTAYFDTLLEDIMDA
ncbi:hypothetical protein SAMN05421736_102391 [Evansella caseinilytica]|uniref:Uncharacterized protein n=1 Tax=Evansella caseinilytica TaxID=1503961 RepID=A0A1H3L7S4_9BACI|nr:hypothetical protein [Evansella caseinilytica]SDY60483.1 hypothetical protein SAMN05421736_102391 [Evansella caseinilytica]